MMFCGTTKKGKTTQFCGTEVSRVAKSKNDVIVWVTYNRAYSNIKSHQLVLGKKTKLRNGVIR